MNLWKAEPSKPFKYVWRMENANEVGPYTGLTDVDEPFWEIHGARINRWVDDYQVTHPEPGVCLPKQYVFGFSSPWQASRWFTKEERAVLAKHGFTLRRVKASSILTLARQIAFVRYV
mgnify:CR=1 FL=1